MDMTETSEPHAVTDGVRAMPAADARAQRIETIYRRGLEEMRRTYDPVRHLLAQGPVRPGGKPTYRAAQSLWLAHARLREGDGDSVREAAAIVGAVLDGQERSPNHPHRGNFRWLADDEEVTDLNAVQFVLRALLPLLILHGERLPPDTLDRCRDAVRLALEEEEHMAVAPTYTNIHVMSLFALLVGGEWLGDAHFQALGRARWDAWVRFTVGSGAPHEYNSPGYGAIDLGALAALHQLVRDARVRLQARLMYERLWLHLALHIHAPTGQHVGPHCRCYWPAMTTGHSALHDLLWRETGSAVPAAPGGPAVAASVAAPPGSVEIALTEHWLPDAIGRWLTHQRRALPYEVREMANADVGADLTTYFADGYALGTASRTYTLGQDDFYIEHQANYCILHYARGGAAAPPVAPPAGTPRVPNGWGMMYSRYVVNDRHWGRLTAALDRPPNSFYDQGHFAGVQQGNKAIALYALMPEHEPVFSLKTVVVFPWPEVLDEIWVNERRVALADLPVSLTPGDWLVVAGGAVYVGVRPLEPSCLGREAPIVLERGPLGELWLTIYNYRGPAKRFWDYASLKGAFWQGNLRAGYVVEVAARGEHPSANAFLSRLRLATVEDRVEATAESPAVRTVTYRSGGDTIALRYDLWRTQPVERQLSGGMYTPPALASPLAVQGDSGRLAAGGATLETNRQMVWLLAQEVDPAQHAWIAVNPDDRPTPLRLETPAGILTAERWGLGRIEWRAPQGDSSGLVILVDTLEAPRGLRAPEGARVELVTAAPQP
ncbi:MAG: hypothetical protein HY332_13880 [Chloroflexi bacterium]|nr:hypothetical protein [Chloroflexota bacterium]